MDIAKIVLEGAHTQPQHHQHSEVMSGVTRKGDTHFAEDDFGGQVLWGATQRPSPTFDPFRETKICYLSEDKAQCEHWDFSKTPNSTLPELKASVTIPSL